MAQLLAHFSFFLMAPLYIANGWHVVFNPSSPLLGSLVATLVIASALAQLLYFSSLLWLTKMLSKINGLAIIMYQIYIIIHSHHYNHGNSTPTHLTGISCASFSFPSCFCRVPQDFVSSGPGLPPALSPASPLQSGMGSSESPFGLEWGLIAGLRGFASHGGSILSRGWLAIVVAPGLNSSIMSSEGSVSHKWQFCS